MNYKFKKQHLKNESNTALPLFTLEIDVPANNIEKQLKKKNIEFDRSVIKQYDKLIKGIISLRNENFISEKNKIKLIEEVYLRALEHVYFIYKMFIKE